MTTATLPGHPSLYPNPNTSPRQDYQGPRVDVWSLGVGLACMLAGGLPF